MLWLLLAASAPTYLACSFDQDGEQTPVEIVVDEADQKAVVSLTSGRTVSRPAVISPSTVRIPDDASTWTIDRANLILTRSVIIGQKEWLDRGKCELKPAPAKRAF